MSATHGIALCPRCVLAAFPHALTLEELAAALVCSRTDARRAVNAAIDRGDVLGILGPQGKVTYTAAPVVDRAVKPDPEPEPALVLDVRELRIRDRRGRVRLTLGMRERNVGDDPVLEMLDEQGVVRIRLKLHEDDPHVELMDAAGDERASLFVHDYTNRKTNDVDDGEPAANWAALWLGDGQAHTVVLEHDDHDERGAKLAIGTPSAIGALEETWRTPPTGSTSSRIAEARRLIEELTPFAERPNA